MRLYLALLFLFTYNVSAQQLQFAFSYNDSLFTNLPEKNIEGVNISKLSFYITDVSFEYKGGSFSAIQNVHLIDFYDSTSLMLESEEVVGLNPVSLHFNLGIDSTTNVSGAMGGDLDPSLGMYWSWQSGYVNFKLEGKAEQINENKSFILHLGGYAFPFKAVQQVLIPIQSKQDVYQVVLQLDELIKEKVSVTPMVMSPSETAVELSVFVANLFSFKE